MKKILTLILILFYFTSYSQNCIKKGKIEQLKQLTERELAVVIYSENKNYIEKLEKKIAKNNRKKAKFEKELNDYKQHISLFNKAVKEAVSTHWKLNNVDNIKYITGKEVSELIKKKSNKFAVLDLTFDVVMTDFNTLQTMDIYVVTYGASEKNRDKAIFKNHITNINYNIPGYADKKQKKQIEKLKQERENAATILSKENLIVSIELTQKYIKKAIELDDKISFEEFATEEAKTNCSQLENSTVLIQEASVHGKIQEDLKKLLPKANIKLVSANRIAEAIENKEDVLIGLLTIKKFVKQKGFITSILPISHKIILNAKSKNIISFIKHSGITSYPYFRKKDFKKLNASCK